jgi:cytochrome c-type biogenesis protein CcmH/NrfG
MLLLAGTRACESAEAEIQAVPAYRPASVGFAHMTDSNQLTGDTVSGLEPRPANDAWHQRPVDELRAIIERGFAGGTEFTEALAETERRSREATEQYSQIKEAEKRRQVRAARLRRTIVLAALAIVAALLAWYLAS